METLHLVKRHINELAYFAPNKVYTFQFIGAPPCSCKILLVLLKQRLPINGELVFVAPSGEGCDDVNTWCFFLSTHSALFSACFPHNRKTSPCFSLFSTRTTLSVNFAQPHLLCEFAFPDLTVNDVFNKNTPWSHHFERHPCAGRNGVPTSLCSSLYMFLRLGGVWIPFLTEKHSPWAWPAPW